MPLREPPKTFPFFYWRGPCLQRHMRGIGKRFVYILQSDSDPRRHYTGVTNDVETRLDWHNHGPTGQTVTHRPWSLLVSIEFPIEQQALRFERYLKSGSGRAFARRHYAPPNDSRDPAPVPLPRSANERSDQARRNG